MKKFALYAGLALALIMLLSFFCFLAEQKAEKEIPEYALGNTPGNIGHGGSASEDENFVYFAVYNPEKSFGFHDYYLYKANKKSGEVKKLASSIHGINYINVVGDYVFYTDSYLGHIKRVKKDGRGDRHLSLVQVDKMLVSGNKIYYIEGHFEKLCHKLYAMDVNGRNKCLISDGIAYFCIDHDTIYYINYRDGCTVWKMDTSGENKKKLFDADTCELLFDEKYIYYVSHPDHKLYRADKETAEVECIFDGRCRSTNIYGDLIYYTDLDDNSSLYSMSKDGTSRTKILDNTVYSLNIVEDGIFCNTMDLEDCYIGICDGKIIDLPN